MNNNLKDLATVVTTVLEGKFAKKQVEQAIEIALDMGGNMTGAVKKIEKIKKGLSDDKDVAAALKAANESVAEGVLTVNDFSFDGPAQKDAKKAGVKIKMVKKGGGNFGGDTVDITGDDAKLIAYAVAHLGLDKKIKKLKDAAKAVNESVEVTELTAVGNAIANAKKVPMLKRLFQRTDMALVNTLESLAALQQIANAEAKEVIYKEQQKTLKGMEKDLKVAVKALQRYMKIRKAGIGFTESVEVTEAKKPGKGKITLDIDFVTSDVGSNKKEVTDAEKKFKIKIKRKTSSSADITGEKKNILAFLRSPSHDMDQDDIEDIFPQIFEAVDTGPMDGRTRAGKAFIERINKRRGVLNTARLSEKELSDKQKKYQEFFAKALKKFDVKSPAELEGDKKKEFFDYIDKNYEGDNESD